MARLTDMDDVSMSDDVSERPRWLVGFLFVAVFLYLWISVRPFENLATASGGSNALNQLVGLAITGVLLLFAVRYQLLGLLLKPRLPIFLLFGWMLIASVLGSQPGTAIQRLVFTGLLCLITSIIAVLPSDRQQFARLLAIASSVLLLVCYAGVILLPARSIHQAYDLSEPALAGDWRGVFNHKNAAAPAMIMLVFFGLYLRGSWSKWKGTIITLLAFVFLMKTNGKTAAMLLPVTLILSWWLERHPRQVLLVVGGLIGLLNLFAVGSTFSSSIRDVVESLGVDATFTGRTDIWELSFVTFFHSPIFGQGFQSFWNTTALLDQFAVHETWAVGAAHAHNGYIESLLNGGLPAFVLTCIWLVILPARDLTKAIQNGAAPDLNRLFARMWIFALLSACLESNFFTGTGPIWSSMLIAIYCMHHQAHDQLCEANVASGSSKQRYPERHITHV
ncbi:O-antigen ligase family protein [Agrobacterium sp. AGB01]|nr:O-antigen ligase [Agrobacterium sp. AGB01]MBD9387271.1 O-antigen ligase family protein [Agrobacterium sp. AGB01]